MMGDLKLKVAVSTGLFGIAKGEELATVVRKIGYGLTRGTSAIELAGDVPHEVEFTDGIELRYIARKQGIDINMHGSLVIPFCIPEMIQWQEAQDHAEKSIKAAVYAGAKYIDFHACLHFWVEMLTYTGSRLEIMMADWWGRFVSDLLYEVEELREYFIERFWEKYGSYILGEEIRAISYRAELEARANIDRKKNSIPQEKLAEAVGKEHTELMRKFIKDALRKKLSSDDPIEREWYFIARERGDYADACEIIAHYIFLKQDPIWKDMVNMYEKELKKYKDWFGQPDPSTEEGKKWLLNCLKKVEETGEKEFKEFYYGSVSAKLLQGHLVELCRWMHGMNMKEKKNSLLEIIENELKIINPPNKEKHKKELMEILKNLVIAIEEPDARDPSYAGRYMLWRTKQIYVAIKHTRRMLKEEGNPHWDKIMLLIDFEHISTQGVDPLEEIADLVKVVPDVGKYIKTVHSNRPGPLHSHFPLELGDDLVYRLLWMLTNAGLGKEQTTYLVFERGGFKDPFRQAVTTLRLIVRFLQKNTHPDKLPDEFYGVYPRGLLAEERQWVTVFQHRMDPLKGLIKIPEEDYTFLSRAAITELGKKPEEWKKEEYR